MNQLNKIVSNINISEPYSLEDICTKYQSYDYNSELLLQHLLLYVYNNIETDENKLIYQELLTNNWPLNLAEDFEGSCPCCEINGKDFHVKVHCWRAGCDSGCEFSGIHVSGMLNKDIKLKIAEYIRDNNAWSNSTDWNLIIS